ncbi:hypothetical protein D3C86_1965840 [compost metagenome]
MQERFFHCSIDRAGILVVILHIPRKGSSSIIIEIHKVRKKLVIGFIRNILVRNIQIIAFAKVGPGQHVGNLRRIRIRLDGVQ